MGREPTSEISQILNPEFTCISVVYSIHSSWETLTNLTHWGRVTYICVCKLTIIGSDNGLSPGRRQAIIWANDGILLIGPLGTNFNEILIEIHTFSFKKMHLKMSFAKWRPFCPGPNVLTYITNDTTVDDLTIQGANADMTLNNIPIWTSKV